MNEHYGDAVSSKLGTNVGQPPNHRRRFPHAEKEAAAQVVEEEHLHPRFGGEFS
jgi:hypothetical protein